MTFDARPYLKELARGRHGARDMTREQARTLFAAVFAGELHDLALGALLVALRVKNESADEIAGMLDALAPHVNPLALPVRRGLPVLVPSYNGARKLPNLVPLMALLLAREGVPVVIHGLAQEESRVSTFDILAALGHAPATSLDDAAARLASQGVAAVPVALLSPALGRLLDARLTTGVRNCGHTLAKLLLPAGVSPRQACRLVPVTHPDFLELVRAHFAASPGEAFFMRGVEGEAVVRLHAPQPIEQVDGDGRAVTHLLPEAVAPELPPREIGATVAWTRAVLRGEKPVPEALARQVALVAGRCREAARAARGPLTIVR